VIRVKRFLPDSIAGWVIVVLIGGLVVSQVVTLAVNYNTRSRTATVLGHFRLAERIADVVRLVGHTMPAQRPALLAAFKSGTLLASLDNTPVVDENEVVDEREATFSSVLQSALWNVPLRNLRVSFRPAPHPAAQSSAGERPRNDTTSVGRTLDEILAENSRVPVVHVSLQLDDATWINFAAPFVEAPKGFTDRSMLLLALAALIVVALSIWAVRRLTAPLATLARAAELLGRDFNAAPLPESGAREMRQAAHAFNLMQQRLQTFVRDRVHMMAAISHDLRTPITRLRLRAEFVDDEEQRRKMLADLADMEAMIDSTLAFAREEASTEEMANVDLVSLVESVCEDRPGVTLQAGTGVDARLPFVCRPLAMRRCLANVVDNAVKYGGCARVRLDAASSTVVVTVEDDGPGIPEAEQERVFAPFERLDSSRSADLGGTGLGLSIARTIARAHGGTVSLANRSEGGLRVTIALPR
jgi:signal transduction histidine kinase